MVQVKLHARTTDDWAVEQIKKYQEQLENPDSELTIKEKAERNEYTNLAWVISTCKEYSEEAIRKSVENPAKSVRLINGLEFARMLLDAGLSNIII